MSRMGITASSALTLASLVLASLVLGSGIGPAASATEDCSLRYKICNGSCNRPIDALDKVVACKNRCDVRLIVCDRQPINASTQGESFSPQSLPPKSNEGLHPVANGSANR